MAGRPKELTEELLDKAREYLVSYESVVPSVAGLALYIGVSRATIYNWRSENDQFLDIVDEVLENQEVKLLDGGLNGNYNASISKLMLTKHGYSDKVETDNKTAIDLSGLTDEQLQAMANE